MYERENLIFDASLTFNQWRIENRSGVTVRELWELKQLYEQERSGCVETAVSGGDCNILTFLTFFIPAVNRPIVLTFVGLLPGRFGSL